MSSSIKTGTRHEIFTEKLIQNDLIHMVATSQTTLNFEPPSNIII